MFCANCGAENDDGVAFCAKCGKNPNGVVVKNEGKQGSGPMVRFVRKAFRDFLEVILWINLIIFTISGWNTGNTIKEIVELVMKQLVGQRNFSAAGFPFFGAILGIFAGLLVNIILGGLIAAITNIDDKIEHINEAVEMLKNKIIKPDK